MDDDIAEKFKSSCAEGDEEKARKGIDAGLVGSPLRAGIFEALRMGHVQMLNNLNTYSREWATRELQRIETTIDDEAQEILRLKQKMGVIVFCDLELRRSICIL